MRATVGDAIVLHGKTTGAKDRHGVISQVKGPDGQPPYYVRFDDGHEVLVFPGADATVVPQPAD